MNYKFGAYEIDVLRQRDAPGEILYVCNNKIIDVHCIDSKGNKKYKKSLTNYIKKFETDKVGSITLNLYNPYDVNRFNIDQPKQPTAEHRLNEYEKNFFRTKENASSDREFIQELQILHEIIII